MVIRSVSLHMLFAALLLNLAAPELSARDEPVERILSAWKSRRGSTKTVRFTLHGTVVHHGGLTKLPGSIDPATVKKLSPEEARRPRTIEHTLLIDLESGRFRIESMREVGSVAGSVKTQVTTVAYNGSEYQTGVPREVNKLGPGEQDVLISKGQLSHIILPSDLWPAFCSIGIVPTVEAPLRPDRLPVHHESEEFLVRGSAIIAGRKCTAIESLPASAVPALHDEFFIDETRGGAVARHIYFNGTNPWYRFDTTFQSTERGWMPHGWTLTHTAGGAVTSVTKITVSKLEFDVSLTGDEFTLSTRPGMLVSSATFPKSGSGLDPERPAESKYRVGPNGEKEDLVEKGFTTKEGIQLAPDDRISIWWWVVGGAALVTLTVVLFRRRASRNSSVS